jgi:putative transposase
MAIRTIPLVTNQLYHVFNQTQPGTEPFVQVKICRAFMDALWYYQFVEVPMKLSYYRSQFRDDKQRISETLLLSPRYVTIAAYCIMPNHYHLLVKQTTHNGISLYTGNVQNSITRFVNIKRKQKGHLFIGQFKAVRIESDEQFLHVSRYIHLNPYTGYVAKTFNQTMSYPWSSCREYISKISGMCDQAMILSHFKTKEGYKNFIEDQKDYQRTLADIKHAVIEKF